MSETHIISPIATISTPFKQKFGIPRQANLSKAKGTVVFDKGFDAKESIKGIQQHSHLWLIFQFDKNIAQGWKPSVRPPRLGGNEKLGVFATRSSFRPNGLGLSVVKLESVEYEDSQPVLHVSNVDMLTGTPIIDIKPYIPYADSPADAHSEFANAAPERRLKIIYKPEAKAQLQKMGISNDEKNLLEEVLSLDPRPAYKANKIDDKLYHLALFSYDIEWQVTEQTCEVVNILPFKTEL